MLKTTFALLFALVLAVPAAAQTNTETVDKTLHHARRRHAES